MTDGADPPVAVSRRGFIKTAASLTALSSSTAAAVLVDALPAAAQGRWDREADVVVVGTGAAGSSAALFAHAAGARVVILEKAPAAGGTTAKSGAMYWIPNNHRMRERGIQDPRDQCLKFMARLGYPTLYNASAPQLGLPASEYRLLTTYYDNAAGVVDELRAWGVGDLAPAGSTYLAERNGDRYPELPEHAPVLGRALHPSEKDGTRHLGNGPNGSFLIRQFQAALAQRNISVLLNHRAMRLIVNGRREVIGLEAASDDRPVTLRARRGVVFGSGGFTANAGLCADYLRGPIFGGCAVPTNEGDFILIAGALGAQLGNMSHAWWGPLILERALRSRSVPQALFSVPGDSVLQVNCEGRRAGDEKRYYNERTQVHFYWDPHRMRYPNLVQVMIYDQRCRERFGPADQTGAVPRPGAEAPHLISAPTLDTLATAVDARLAEVAARTGNFRLDADFAPNLRDTVARFNRYAESGVDLEFRRGEFEPRTSPGNGKPNPTMYPLSASGPYYAVLVGGGTLDTKGGPRINEHAEVLNTDGQPIPGLYGAGNCIAAPAGQGYWSGGGTIGPAMTFGAIAGRRAAAAAERQTA